MNTDVEGGRSKPAALLTRGDNCAEELAETTGVETVEVNPPLDGQAGRRNGTTAVSVTTPSLPMIQSHRPGVLSAHWVTHATILVLLGAALILGRLPWLRSSAGSALPAHTFTQRVLLLASPNRLAYTGTGRGFLRRRIPPVTADTPDIPDTAQESVLLGRGGSRFVDAGFITRGIDPEGSLRPVERTEVITYSVRHGDTLWDIAAKFNITQDTLWANNDLPSPDMLSVGDVLTIPPIDGLIYTVRRGDTLAGLAQRYRTTVEAIVNYAPNGLSEGQQPVVGQKIMIPGGVKPIPARRTVSLTRAPPGALKGGGSFVMPVSGILTQGFRPGHPAIDIAAPKGAPVYAADAGYVSFAGWHPLGYGYAVEINHGNGFRTLYAHLSWYEPDVGESVKRGQLIGGVGSTYGSGGWSTGPHLHFEIIQNGAKRNPCLFVACP